MFTPAVQASAIGRMACLVTQSLLSMGHDVAIVRSESEELLDAPAHPFPAALVPWNETSIVGALTESDAEAIIYHVGDNYHYHKGCLEWLPRHSGTVCLHDFFLGNLFYMWSVSNPSQGRAILKRWYGAEAAGAFFGFTTMEKFIEGTRNTAPLTEWICSMASGVITHSSWGIDRVLKACPGPVEVVPLAYDLPRSEGQTDRLNRAGDSFNILTIGHVNFNKRAESVIKALGSSRTLRRQAVYRLVGAVRQDVRERLTALAFENKVRLVISGEVNDVDLVRAISEADVVSCLRWPTLEAASASAIEAMLYGKPTIVTDAGFYSEIPNDYVLKIDPTDEIAGICTALERLLNDRDLRLTLGKRAKSWAQKTFSANNYAMKTVEMAVRSNEAQPAIVLANYFSNLIQGWGGSSGALCAEETLPPLEIFQ